MNPSMLQGLEEATRRLKSARTMQSERPAQRGGTIQAKQNVQKTDITTVQGTQYAHGPQGVFSQAGVDNIIYSTLVRPLGMSNALPLVKSQYMTPLFEIMTGQKASTGSEPYSECATPISVGNMKVGFLTAPFGRFMRKTPNLLFNRIGQLVNNAEPLDLRVVNDLQVNSPWVPDPAKNPDFMNSELGKQYFQLGLEFERLIEPILFTGNPTNMYTSGGPDYGYREFAGFDLLINTGKTDAITGMALPSADSLIVDWASALITGTTTLSGENYDIVQTMSAMENYIYSKAERQGMLPLDLVWAMRADLFYELTRLWPCSYITNGCTTAVLNGGTQFVQASEQIQMRDSMRTGKFLWVNGKQMPVVITDGIAETAGGGGAKSDVYLIPRSAKGSYTAYLQYFDLNNQQINEVLGNAMLGTKYSLSNGGLFMWTYQADGYCFYLEAKVEPRLILRTPWLAARLTNVVYHTAIHTVDGFVSSLYPAPNGGATIGSFGGGIYPYAY